MSRVGRQPIKIPEKVKVILGEGILRVEGPQGKLEIPLNPLVEISISDGTILVRSKGEGREARTHHGLCRNLIWNMVEGVSQGFQKVLEISGVGYRAEVKGSQLNLSLGFSHPVDFEIPKGVQVQVEKQVRLVVSGPSKQLVGETAARIRRLKPPEPYKAKGIRYSDEIVRRKVGKAAVVSGGKQ